MSSSITTTKKLRLLHLCPAVFDSPFHRDGGFDKGLQQVFAVERFNIDELRLIAKDYCQAVLDLMKRCRPQLVLVTNNSIDLKLLADLKKQAVVLTLLQDTHSQVWDRAIELGRCSHGLLVNTRQAEHFETYHQAGIKHVYTFYQGADPDSYYPLHEDLAACPIDVIFIGKEKSCLKHDWYQTYSMYQRAKIVYQLAALEQLRFMVIGKNWNRYKLEYYVKEAFKQSANYYMSGSKLTLGIQGNPHVAGAMSIRYFNHLLTGRLHLALYSQGAEQVFQDGVHLRYYRTIDELKDLIFYYLDHLDEANRIGRQGREEILAKHTYECRARELLEIYCSVRRGA
jgi:hypothetical protein